MDNNDTDIYEIAYMLCEKKIHSLAKENIKGIVSQAIDDTVNRFKDEVENVEGLLAYLNERVSQEREEEDPVILLGQDAKNETWWKDFRSENDSKLRFWHRYYKYLYENKNWERSAIKKSIDNTTDTLLNSLANPTIGVSQEKKAMVVGYVQSGKTANYIGLINKALDAGYKYIIVLAGIHNNLRSQTQSRIDEEVLGYETDSAARQKQRERAEKNKIGVGKLLNAGFVQTLTFRDEKGDFSKARSRISTSPDIATIIVTKKTKSTLTNLIDNIESNSEISKDPDTGQLYLRAKYPLLLIDDEADQASVNTAYDYDDDGNVIDEYDVKTINKLIRTLLKHFDCKSYVGYTATPYANIFIPNNIENSNLGNDLFPEDCIVSLPKPYRYIGANEFFGYGNEDDNLKPMPLVRKMKESNFVDVKKKTIGDLPKSLKEAIMSFIISVAIRNCRGEKYKPNTMLIHVARIKNMHAVLEKKVKDYFDVLQSMIIDNDTETIEKIRYLLIKDYFPTTKIMKVDFKRYMDGVEDDNIEEVFSEINRLMNEDCIKIHVINGDSKDSLCYKENEGKEYNVIAIGGDKFSRGLTLEGLSISYFTRESKYYDSLMQMGRWFGFRPKYADLCRVYITKNIYNWFARIAFATDNLRNQISYMCDENAKPKDFGLRVVTHPELKISNPQKVKSGSLQKLDFSNTLTVTRDIDVDEKEYKNNFEAIENLFATAEKIYTSDEHFLRLGRKNTNNNHYFLENISGKTIADFMEQYQTSKFASKVNGHNISTYIKEQLKDGYLVDWTVCLINVGKTEPGINIAGKIIGNGIIRKGENSVRTLKDGKVCSVHMLKSKHNEYYALSKIEYDKAIDIEKNSQKENESTIAANIRAKMDVRKGLLLIYPIDYRDKCSETRYFNIAGINHKPPFGLVIVFPKGTGKSISYQLNPIATMEEYYAFD